MANPRRPRNLLGFGLLLGFVLLVTPCFGHYGPFLKNIKDAKAGPTSIPTKGEPWPKPQFVQGDGKSFMIVRPAVFRFQVLKNTCDILEQALKRYYSIILRSNGLNLKGFSRAFKNQHGGNYSWKNSKDFSGYLDVLKLDLESSCEDWPHENMDESYEIGINTKAIPGEGFLLAPSVWGMLRALETFSQLLIPTADFTALEIKSTFIIDYPRFGFRSLLLDTSRHYLPKRVIYENLDLMAMNKLNVFHWHIVDSQAFPYQSKTFPDLSDKGAYHPYTHVYTRQDVHDVIDYARLRGIRVIPEFDSPGHTESWGLSQPDLLTKCYNKTTGQPDGTFGPIDPTNNTTFDFLKSLFKEIVETFPDKYLHLGGDEVDSGCWKSNPNIQNFMKAMNFSQDFTRLQDFYTQKLVNIVRGFPQNKTYMVWQEVFDNKVDLDPSTIVHVWKSGADELHNVTARGFRTLLSTCWYLDYISYGVDWHPYYHCDPQDFNGTVAQKKLVLGGGPAMWGEMIDATNLVSNLWPRASVPAERLWSSQEVNDVNEATPRLEEHRCRLLKRGFKVQPINGPGFCSADWQ